MLALDRPVASSSPSSPTPRRAVEPARAPRGFLCERLLHVDPRANAFHDHTIRNLPDFLERNDVVVLNDAATLPASLPARTLDGRALEVRLLGELAPSRWSVALLGEGDHRTPTEHRPAPPSLPVGATLRIGAMHARVVSLSARSPREAVIELDRRGAPFWTELYAVGRLVQYAHVPDFLPLWEMQSSYASRPWAVEMPSAGRPLRWEILDALRRKGVALATLTHAAGISSTGDDAIDRALPLAERYEIPASTVDVIERAKGAGGRVLAVGTSVVRALEGSALAHDGRPVAERAETELKIDGNFQLRVIDGLLTGMHDDPTTSHHSLLCAFAPARLLDRAHAHAATVGYVGHELGDSTLILASR